MTSRHLRHAATAVAATCALTAMLQCGATASAAEPATTVDYRGLSLSVPADWNVVDLAEDPQACVRMDRHTVYLGHPGTDQSCPTHLIAEKTEAIVLEPFAGAGPRTDVPQVDVPDGALAPRTLPRTDSREVRLAFEGAGVYATVSHGPSPAAMEEILGSVEVRRTAEPQDAPAPAPEVNRMTAALAAVTPSTGYKGKAFDACAAPSSAAMADWAASPYRGLGIYMGGPSRVCSQPNLTASWVSDLSADGWHFLPIYAGLQAGSISSSTATSQGRAAADAAVDLAQGLGFAPGTVLYIDMEAYSSTYRTRVLEYLSGWTDRIQELHYRSGVYSSSSSGIKDLSSVYSSTTLKRPDVVWTANWNGQADTYDPNLPADQWADHQRVHQYAGNVTETYNGTTIQIDRNYVDVGSAAVPMDPGMTDLTAGDFNGDGRADLVAVEVSSGKLWLYPGTGAGTLKTRVLIGTGGWNGMEDLAVGDFTKDGRDDVVAVEKSTGKLWLYKGTGSGLASRVEIGTGGWNGMSNVFAGDFNGDGVADVGASENETGKLFLYPGRGDGTISGLGGRVEIGTGGWNGMNKVVSPGDMNRDGRADVVATEKSTGKLWLYKGTGSGLASRVEIGTGGWNGISDYAGADFSGDGVGDLAAVESDTGETGKLYLYKGTGSGGLTSRTEIGTGGW
ncbi:glycoside hydrolase domain-containing protein [Streptomyces sp. NPDC006134]|uniref:glycoside hydrolase domain-containing protein n=1 Tax=Streptomyces sp. NPDC006134 TaxID=3154467 RepID=UPI0033E9F0B1